MYKQLIRKVFDKFGLTDGVDDVIASNIDRFQFDEQKKQTIFLRVKESVDNAQGVIILDPDKILGFPEVKCESKVSADFGNQVQPMRVHSYKGVQLPFNLSGNLKK